MMKSLDESTGTPQHQQTSSSSSSSSNSSSGSSSSASSIGSPETSFGNTEEDLKKTSCPSSSNLPFTKSNSIPQHFQGRLSNWNMKKKAKMVSEDSRKNYKEKALGKNRNSSGTRDPAMAPGKRRRELTRQFMELSSMIPALKKMDKVSIVDDAINYVKELQERVNVLEEEMKKNSAEKTMTAMLGEGTSSSMEELPEIDVKAQEKNVLIKIHCENQNGYLSRILREIEKLHLNIVTFSALPFADRFLDTTVSAQMGDKFCMTIKDLKRDLRLALLQFM